MQRRKPEAEMQNHHNLYYILLRFCVDTVFERNFKIGECWVSQMGARCHCRVNRFNYNIKCIHFTRPAVPLIDVHIRINQGGYNCCRIALRLRKLRFPSSRDIIVDTMAQRQLKCAEPEKTGEKIEIWKMDHSHVLLSIIWFLIWSTYMCIHIADIHSEKFANQLNFRCCVENGMFTLQQQRRENK